MTADPLTICAVAYAIIGAPVHLWTMNRAFVQDHPKNPDLWLATEGVVGLLMFPFWPLVFLYIKRR